MQLSLDDTVVDWLIFALRSAATLPADLQIVPFQSSEKAEGERLIVKSVKGEQLLEGGRLFPCETSFELRTTKRNALEANDIFAKVEAAIYGAPTAAAITRAGELFKEVFLFPENAQNESDANGNPRVYKRTLPLQTNFAGL